MNDIVTIIIYISLFIILFGIFSFSFAKSQKTQNDVSYLYLCICVIGWLISETAIKFIYDERLSLYFYNLALIFVGFLPIAFFNFSFYFYMPERKLRFISLLFIIPTINALMSISSNFHSLSIISVGENLFVVGPWFYVHTIFSYTITSLSLIVIMYGHIKLPKFYRLPSALLVLSIFILIGGNFIFLMGLRPSIIGSANTTLLSSCISIILIHIAIIKSDENVFSRYARGEVFNYLNEHVLVMNIEGRIVDCNSSAKRWLSSMEIDFYLRPLKRNHHAYRTKRRITKRRCRRQ